MSLQEGLKLLRVETGYTQMELSRKLGIGFATLNRWENERTRPNHSGSAKLIAFARESRVSSACMEYLYGSLYSSRARNGESVACVQETAEKMKFEDMERLTSVQLKMVVDHIPMGVIALRKYRDVKEDRKIDVFYFNEGIVQMLGYTRTEIYDQFAENIYFWNMEEEIENYKDMLCRVLSGQLPYTDASMELRVKVKNGDIKWVRMQILVRSEYSFGTELFVTYEDITAKKEAQNKYEAEVKYRRQMLGEGIGWAYCDITNNAVVQKKVQSVGELCIETMDDLFHVIEERMGNAEDIETFREKFSRKRMIQNFDMGEKSASVTYYDKHINKWAKISYYMIQNPVKDCLEGFVYAHDAQKEILQKSIIHILSQNMFDYIGCIYVESREIECYIQEEKKIHMPRMVSMDELEIIKEYLEQKEFVSFYQTMGIEGEEKKKKITFRYMSDAKHVIIMSISDVEKLSVLRRKEAMKHGE